MLKRNQNASSPDRIPCARGGLFFLPFPFCLLERPESATLSLAE
jgi:hypothetical protein